MITEAYPFIIHVRELLTHHIETVLSRVRQARGVIFIDDSVVSPFSSLSLDASLVLPNPVDMRSCASHLEKVNPFAGGTVVTIIGRVEDGKGIDFIIDAFKKTSANRLHLLIVGDKGDGFHGKYVSACRDLAAGDSRISFWGEEKDINKIYAWSDYVIRGEIDFRMGRSVLEALYADCDVIIPVKDRSIVETNPELRKFRGKVHRYTPRDKDSLAEVFSRIAGRKILKSRFESNTEKYAAAFNRYVRRIIESGCA